MPTTYKTPPLITQESYNTAMFDMENLTNSLGWGTGSYAGVRFVSAVLGEDQVLTIVLSNPLPEVELPQYSFIPVP